VPAASVPKSPAPPSIAAPPEACLAFAISSRRARSSSARAKPMACSDAVCTISSSGRSATLSTPGAATVVAGYPSQFAGKRRPRWPWTCVTLIAIGVDQPSAERADGSPAVGPDTRSGATLFAYGSWLWRVRAPAGRSAPSRSRSTQRPRARGARVWPRSVISSSQCARWTEVILLRYGVAYTPGRRGAGRGAVRDSPQARVQLVDLGMVVDLRRGGADRAQEPRCVQRGRR
jgi:hypothetical protein